MLGRKLGPLSAGDMQGGWCTFVVGSSPRTKAGNQRRLARARPPRSSSWPVWNKQPSPSVPSF